MTTEIRTLTQIMNNEMREFSMYTIENRAIPSVIDGLKISQRKLLYAMINEHHGKRVKVAELGGGLAKFNFHHGEQSAIGAAVGLSQPWSNNAPIFEGHGNFGSRLVQEAAAARYIYSSISPNFKKYFRDEEVAPPAFDPENPEPAFYLPIIPWVLVNGISGIAVGFKAEILPRSIQSLVAATKACLKDPEKFLKDHADIAPSFPEFKGKVAKVSDNQWKTIGKIEYIGRNTFSITELPIGFDRESYVEFLNTLIDKDMIRDYEDACSKDGFGFNVKVSLQNKIDIEKDPLKYFKLEKIHTEILTTLGCDGKLKIFDHVSKLIHYFITYRLEKFGDKIKYDINEMTDELAQMRAKIKFIKCVIGDEINFKTMTKAELLVFISKQITTEEWGAKFIHIPLYECTKDQVDALIKKCVDMQARIIELNNTTPAMLYVASLKGV